MEFQTFDSFDEMLEAMRKSEDEANSHLSALQRAVTWGDYWVRFEPQASIVIFGYCYTEEESKQAEIDCGATEKEAEWSLNRLRDSHERGYLFGLAYSIVEPDGEVGSTHKANVWPIERGLFNAAKEVGWNLGEMRLAQVSELETIYNEIRKHFLAQMVDKTTGPREDF